MNKYKALLEKVDAMASAQKRSIRVLAVSKSQTAQSIRNLYDQGCRHFGQNYLDELLEKHSQVKILFHESQLPKDIRWHFIGHLQSNKVKKLLTVPNLHLIESVDRQNLAEKLNSELKNHPDQMKVLVQVKTSDQDTKNGIPVNQTTRLVDFIRNRCQKLQFTGLMTIGKKGDYAAFTQMTQLKSKIMTEADWNNDQEFVLSMGMSEDYEAAIQHGSNQVRVGSLIFGPRAPKNAHPV